MAAALRDGKGTVDEAAPFVAAGQEAMQQIVAEFNATTAAIPGWAELIANGKQSREASNAAYRAAWLRRASGEV